MKSFIANFGLLLLFSGCANFSERDERLNRKDAELRAREDGLRLREEKLKVQENEIRTLGEKLRNGQQDSVINKYLGRWNVKMSCVESTCSGSVVGDVKSESWLISARTNMLLARVMVDGQIVRLYTGVVTEEGAKLFEEVEAVRKEQSAKIAISLTLLADGTMEGKRVIARDDGCTIVYELHLKRALQEKRIG